MSTTPINAAKFLALAKPLYKTGTGLDARTQYLDVTLTPNVNRDYQSTTEVLAYLSNSNSTVQTLLRSGGFPIFVNVGGTLNSDGTYTGGTRTQYWFKDGVADGNLVLFSASAQGIGTTDSPTFAGITITGSNPLNVNKSTGTSDAPIVATQVGIPDFTLIDVLQVGIENTDGKTVNWKFRAAGAAPGENSYDVIIDLPQYVGGGMALTSDIATALLTAFNDQSGTAYTLVLGDMYKKVRMTNAAANVVTIPTNANAAFKIGSFVKIAMNGTGSTSVIGDTGVTLEGADTVIDIQYDEITLIKEDTDTWRAVSNEAAYAPIVKAMADIPEVRVITKADSAYASLSRTIVGGDNEFSISNELRTVGGIGQCLDFNGAAFQYVDIPTTNLPGVATDFTFSLWFKTLSNSNNGGFQIGIQNPTNSLMQLGFGYQGDQVYTSGWGNGSNAFTQAGLNDNNWHHLAVTVVGDGVGNSTVKSYLDGNLKSTIVAGNQSFVPNNYNFRIGTAATIITGSSSYFTGSIDSVLGWTRGLNGTEISAIYNGGHGTAMPPTGQLFRYEFEEGIGNYTNDTNDTVTPVTGTLTNTPKWDALGIVPVLGTSGKAQVVKSFDGSLNGERGVAQFGDVIGRFQAIGRWFQFFQSGKYPFVSNNTGQFLFNPANNSESVPTIASAVDIAANMTVGSSFAGILSAPSDGIAVEGRALFGTAVDNTDDAVQVGGNVALVNPGDKIKVATGTNASIGTATLVAGTVTVNTTAVATGSIIIISRNTPGGTPGNISAPSASIVNGTSFIINSDNVADTSTVNYWIIN